MSWLSSMIVVIALLEGGWLVFDGARAIVVGDYVTPSSGPFAGQLGPWSKLVEAIGIEPRSTLMKAIHVAVGTTMLIAAGCWMAGWTYSWTLMLLAAIAVLWYLPLGTLLSLVQISMLIFWRMQS